MALLEIKGLTVRFGGLTAVSGLDLRVENGQVFSLIGPNGAGKTTVFNVITGIYEPTAGSVLLDGRHEGQPLTWKRLVAFLLIGVATGLAALLASANVDRLWYVSIRRNMADPERPFSYAAAWRDARAYLRGELSVEKQRILFSQEGPAPWAVVTADGKVLGTAAGEENAERLKEKLQQIIDLRGSERTLEHRGGRWLILSADGKEVLASHATRQEAQAQLAELARVGEEQEAQRRIELLALAGGFGLGLVSAFVYWRRTRRTPEAVALEGISRTFQNIRLFPEMTVLENVLVGMDRSFPGGLLGMAAGVLGLQRWDRAAAETARDLLAFVGLEGRGGRLAKELPYGGQRRLEIARALATRPKLLLLDEPAAGMNPSETAGLMALIKDIRGRGVTIVLIEHHMSIVMAISDRLAVLDHGVKIAEGTPEKVRKDPKVIAAYLGEDEVA